MKIPASVSDEQALFLTDIFPTGYMAAENCGIEKGDTVAVWGCGPVGQFAIRSAFLLGAERVIAIDRFHERLKMAEDGGATTLDYEEDEVFDTLVEMTGGMGPDSCIDAVGMEAHGRSFDAYYDRAKQALMLEMDRSHALRQAIHACRKGGTVSVPGVYAGFLDKMPFGQAFNKGVAIKGGQTNMQSYTKPLLGLIESGKIDPSFVITHTISLDEAADGYDTFNNKEDECIKFMVKP